MLCVDKGSLKDKVTMNISSTINQSSRPTASTCIQYCRGSDFQNKYAVLGQSNCSCAFDIQFDQTFSEVSSSLCGLSSAKSFIGNDSNNGKYSGSEYFCFFSFVKTVSNVVNVIQNQ